MSRASVASISFWCTWEGERYPFTDEPTPPCPAPYLLLTTALLLWNGLLSAPPPPHTHTLCWPQGAEPSGSGLSPLSTQALGSCPFWQDAGPSSRDHWLVCQLFGSICSHTNCAQRRGDRLQAPRMWVSEIHGPLTVPPWATPAAEGQGGVRLSLSLFALSSVPLVSPWLRYVTGIQVFARKGGGDSVGRKKKTSPITEKPGHGGTTSPPAHLAGVGSKHELPAPANGVCSETLAPTPAEEGGAGDQHWTERKPFSAY